MSDTQDPVAMLRAAADDLAARLVDADAAVVALHAQLDAARRERDELRSLLRKTERAHNAMTVTRTRTRKATIEGDAE